MGVGLRLYPSTGEDSMWISLLILMTVLTVALGVFIYKVMMFAISVGWSKIDTAFACFIFVVYSVMIYSLVNMWLI